MKAELGGKAVVIVKAMARGKHKGSVARAHFCIFQLCLKDDDANSSLCAIENLPRTSSSEKEQNSLTLGLSVFGWFKAVA